MADVSVRYKQTVVGVAYAVMVFAGLLPWQFFSSALSSSSQSLIANANLITKVYFPRLIIPTSTVVVAFVNFCVSFKKCIG